MFMNHASYLAAALLTGFACAGTAQTPPPTTLEPGDPAPPMVIEKWLSGTAVDLKDGKVHVIEFWATWCEPCKEGMPHLSNLAAKYRGRAGFAGISVWENGKDQLARVEKFVAHAGDSMAYPAAFSGEGRSTMGRTWLEAAGVRGIPSAFIIDRRGRVAWVGHPGEGLEDALRLALQDELTPAAAAQVDAAYKEKLKGMEDLKRRIEAAAQAADVPQLRKLVHEATDLRYSAATSIVPNAYVTLANGSPESAAVFAGNILEDYGNAPKVMMAVVNAISRDNERIQSNPDVAFASKAMARVAATSEVDKDFHLLFARVAFQAGDYDAAIKAQGEALKDAQSFLETAMEFEASENVRERQAAPLVQKGARMQVDAYQKTLDEYKAAAAAQPSQTPAEYTINLTPSEVRYQGFPTEGPVVNQLGGVLRVDGVDYRIYIPAKGPYSVRNTRAEREEDKKGLDFLLFSNATRISVDYNNDGRILGPGGEYWAANYPIRFGSRMLAVKSISDDGRTLVLTDSQAPLAGMVVGQPAPDFEFTDQAGKTHVLRDYRGKFLIIDLWSITCHPCQANMSKVLELQKQFGEEKLKVLLVSVDRSYGLPDVEKRNRDTLDKLGIPWPNILMPNAWNEMVKKFNTHGYGLWMIDPEGKAVVAGPGHEMEPVYAALKFTPSPKTGTVAGHGESS